MRQRRTSTTDVSAANARVLWKPARMSPSGPLPFFSLVCPRRRGAGVSDSRPTGLGVVVGGSQGDSGWSYAVSFGGVTWSFEHNDLIPLGHIASREVIYGTDDELEALRGQLVHPDT